MRWKPTSLCIIMRKISKVAGFFSGPGRYTECDELDRGDKADGARLGIAQDEPESIAANTRAKLQEEVKSEKRPNKTHLFESTSLNGRSDYNVQRTSVDDVIHSSVVDGTHKVERRRHRKRADGKEETLRTDSAFPPDGFNGFGPVTDSFSGFGDFAPFEPWDRGANTWPTVPATAPVDPPADMKAREALPTPVPSCHVDSNLSSGMPPTNTWPTVPAISPVDPPPDMKAQEAVPTPVPSCHVDSSLSSGMPSNFVDPKCQLVGKEMVADGCQADDSFSDGNGPMKSVSSSTFGSPNMETVVSDAGRFDDAILAALCALPRDSLVHVLRRAAISRPEEVTAVWGPQGQASQLFLPDALSEQ